MLASHNRAVSGRDLCAHKRLMVKPHLTEASRKCSWQHEETTAAVEVYYHLTEGRALAFLALSSSIGVKTVCLLVLLSDLLYQTCIVSQQIFCPNYPFFCCNPPLITANKVLELNTKAV